MPQDNGAKVFTCFFILLGLMLMGYFFIVLGQMIVDGDQQMRAAHEYRIDGLMNKITRIRTQSLTALREKWSLDIAGLQSKSQSR